MCNLREYFIDGGQCPGTIGFNAIVDRPYGPLTKWDSNIDEALPPSGYYSAEQMVTVLMHSIAAAVKEDDGES